MIFILIAYIVASIAIGVTAWSDAGWIAGASAIGAAIISIIAGSGLRSSMYRDTNHKIAGLLIASVLMAILTFILAPQFTVNIAGVALSGLLWGWIGGVLAFLTTNRKLAEAA